MAMTDEVDPATREETELDGLFAELDAERWRLERFVRIALWRGIEPVELTDLAHDVLLAVELAVGHLERSLGIKIERDEEGRWT